MALPQLNLPGVFGPAELTALSTAFDLALNRVPELHGAALDISARDLRRRLAAGIIAAAQGGIADAEALATEGLRGLAGGHGTAGFAARS